MARPAGQVKAQVWAHSADARTGGGCGGRGSMPPTPTMRTRAHNTHRIRDIDDFIRRQLTEASGDVQENKGTVSSLAFLALGRPGDPHE